jgi:hypothetical protein
VRKPAKTAADEEQVKNEVRERHGLKPKK